MTSRVLLPGLVVLAWILCLPATSSATTYRYFNSSMCCFETREGPRHSITQNFGQIFSGNQYVVGVWALNSTHSSWVGSAAWGNGTAVHSYCGCALRYPVLLSGEPGSHYFQGIGTY